MGSSSFIISMLSLFCVMLMILVYFMSVANICMCISLCNIALW